MKETNAVWLKISSVWLAAATESLDAGKHSLFKDHSSSAVVEDSGNSARVSILTTIFDIDGSEKEEFEHALQAQLKTTFGTSAKYSFEVREHKVEGITIHVGSYKFTGLGERTANLK